MKCTDFWKIETELRKQAAAELKKAIEAHGGEYTFFPSDDYEEWSDEELERNQELKCRAPIVLCNHEDEGPFNLRVRYLSTKNGLRISGEMADFLDAELEVEYDTIIPSDMQIIIEYMKEPDAVD